jgi:hypothetical protein
MAAASFTIDAMSAAGTPCPEISAIPSSENAAIDKKRIARSTQSGKANGKQSHCYKCRAQKQIGSVVSKRLEYIRGAHGQIGKGHSWMGCERIEPGSRESDHHCRVIGTSLSLDPVQIGSSTVSIESMFYAGRSITGDPS